MSLLPWVTSHNGRGDALVIEEDRGDGSALAYTAMEIAKCRTMREARAIVAARAAQIEVTRLEHAARKVLEWEDGDEDVGPQSIEFLRRVLAEYDSAADAEGSSGRSPRE